MQLAMSLIPLTVLAFVAFLASTGPDPQASDNRGDMPPKPAPSYEELTSENWFGSGCAGDVPMCDAAQALSALGKARYGIDDGTVAAALEPFVLDYAKSVNGRFRADILVPTGSGETRVGRLEVTGSGIDARAYWRWDINGPVKERFMEKVKDAYKSVRGDMRRAYAEAKRGPDKEGVYKTLDISPAK